MLAPAPPGPQVRAHLPGKAGPLPCWTRGPMLALKCPCAHRLGKKPGGLWILGSVSQWRWLTPRCALLQIEQRKYHILNDLLTDTIFFLSGLFLLCGSCNSLSSHTFSPRQKNFYSLPLSFFPPTYFPAILSLMRWKTAILPQVTYRTFSLILGHGIQTSRNPRVLRGDTYWMSCNKGMEEEKILTEHWQCTSHSVSCFPHTPPHLLPTASLQSRQLRTIIPFHRWRNWGLKRSRELPRHTHLVRAKVRISTQVF